DRDHGVEPIAGVLTPPRPLLHLRRTCVHSRWRSRPLGHPGYTTLRPGCTNRRAGSARQQQDPLPALTAGSVRLESTDTTPPPAPTARARSAVANARPSARRPGVTFTRCTLTHRPCQSLTVMSGT